MIANVKIEQSAENCTCFRVYKDGKKITRVRHVDANFDVDEVPTVNVEIVGGLDLAAWILKEWQIFILIILRRRSKKLAKSCGKNSLSTETCT